MLSADNVPLDSIEVNERIRVIVGDLAGLKDSIRELGLLHPPVVRRDGDRLVLVAGFRRVMAMREMGYHSTQVSIVAEIWDELAALAAERDENTCRKDFTPSEAVAMADRIEATVRAAAKARQMANLAQNRSEDSSERSAKGETREIVAKAAGMSHPKLAQAREVIAAAKDETLPEPVREAAQRAIREMDATGNVNGAIRKIENAKFNALADAEHELLRETLEARGIDCTPLPPHLEAERKRISRIVSQVLGAVEDMCATATEFPVTACEPVVVAEPGFPTAAEIQQCIKWLAGLLMLATQKENAAA